MAEPNWTSIDPNLGGVTGQTWSTVGVDWEPAYIAPPDYAQPLTPTYYPEGPTRTSTFRFLLLDAGLGVIGELHPNRASPPQITNRPSGAIKRRLTRLDLLPGEATDVNPVTDRVMVEYVPGDGSAPAPLGVFMWADAVYPLHSYGYRLDSTLHDQGIILGQPMIDSVSYPTGHSIYDALFQVAAWSGFPNADIDPVPGEFVAPQAWAVSETNTYYSVLAAIGLAAGTYEPYFTNTGRLRIRLVGDLSLVVPDIVYTDGITGNILRDSVFIANNLIAAPNRYTVVNTAQGGGVVATYYVPDDSPHSYANRNWYATKVLNLNGVTDAAAAIAAATAYARQDQDAYEDVMWQGIFDPRHDTLDVVRVLGLDLLETEWSATLSAEGAMAHKGKRIRHSEVRIPGGAVVQPPPITPPDVPPPVEPPVEPPPAGETIVATYEAEDATLSSVAPPPAGTGNWSINAAGRLINPDGQRTRLLGMNGTVDVSNGQPFIFNYPRAAADGGGRESFTNRINDILNWGWNAVRCTVVLSDGVYGGNSLNAVIDLLDDCAAAGVVLIVGVLESQDQTTNPVQGNAIFTNWVLPFFEDLLAARPNNPWLWCNPGMEAYESTDGAAWASFHTWLYNSLRGYTGGANNMITVTSYDSGQTPVSVAQWNSFASGKTNVVLDWHTYAAHGGAAWHESWRQTLRNGNVPFVVNEFGQAIDGVSACCGANYTNQHEVVVQNLGTWYAEIGESIVGWIATGDSSGSYSHAVRGTAGAPYGYTSYSQPLSDYGQRFWNVRSLAKVY